MCAAAQLPHPSFAECCAVSAAAEAAAVQWRRKPRHPWRRIARDALAVLCGLRPAALLDYAVLDTQRMMHLAAALRAAAGPAGQCLATAEFEGTMYFLHAPWLLRRLESGPAAAAAQHSGASESVSSAACGVLRAAGDCQTGAAGSGADEGGGAANQPESEPGERPHPRLIAFVADEPGGGSAARWATSDEQQAAWAALRRLREPLAHAAAALREPLPSAFEPCNAAVGAAAPASHLRLDAVEGLPLLPTLNGWLLGYPVAYLVSSQEEAGTASRHLSASPLLLCEGFADCCVPGLKPQDCAAAGQGAANSRRRHADSGNASADALFAFTCPTSLCDTARACGELEAASWLAPGGSSGEATAAWSAVWQTVRSMSPRGISL